MVAAARITVLLESSVKQQEIQEMGSVETTSKHGTGYVFVSNKENIWAAFFLLFFNIIARSISFSLTI